MIQNNITNNCPTYEDLYYLGLDTSLHGTGEFGFNDGFFERGLPQYHDVHELYRYEDSHILIDPPNEIASRSKLIVISASLPEYVPLGEYVKYANHTRVLEKDRYVSNCSQANITSQNWSDLLADTIYYLRNGCTHSVFDTRVIMEDHISKFNREDTRQWKYDQWITESKENCKGLCKEY
jgi:hypothetical protein